ncbi:glycosyltransferase family 39 protein [Kineococcus sp. NBC_00420]|uniref:glycosyltransferase family 39 protein n=1 Tax=Kineococcus sp. NBC_00420 TaxID=2903564 RepID=UPI002E1F4720
MPGLRETVPRGRVDVLIGLLAAIAGAVVFSWRLGTPSPWRDEAVTIAVASRTPEQIWRLVQHVDLVHAPFYFLAHALFGSGVDVVQARWISVVAASLTVAALYGVARRAAAGAVGPVTARITGVAAAALFVSMPFVSRYAQEARPYALATLVATLGTYLLLRACAARRAGWWVAYTLTIPLLVAFNTVAALVLVAHAGWALTGPRRVRWRAAVAAGTGVVLAVPLLLAQSRQSGQVAFLQRPTTAELGAHVDFALGSSTVALVVAGLTTLVGLRWARARRLQLLGFLWGVLPWPLLWALSQVHPLWTTRYLVFVAPGTCLFLAVVVTAAVRVRRTAVVAGALVAAMALTGLHMQFVFRSPTIGHAEDLRGTAEYVRAHAQPGDGLLFVPDGEYRYRVLTQLYPEAFAGLDDIALAEPAAESATLVGTTVEAPHLWSAMAGVGRIWVIGGVGPVVTKTAEDRETVRLLNRGYRLVSTEDKRAFSVKLYVLEDTGAASR